jgi:arylsulfatase A-like enzyme
MLTSLPTPFLPRLKPYLLVLAVGGLSACSDQTTSASNDVAANTTTPTAAATPAQKPNILLIVADDLGYSDLSLYGSEIPTPNIDELARNGMLLDNFYSGLTCSPTRSMLLSGTDNHVAGVGVMGAPTREDHKNQPGYEGYLNFRVASLADLLSDAGYNTYMTGKWHLGADVENGPRARGFQKSFASMDGAAHLGGWDWRGPTPADYRDGDALVNVGDDFYTTRDYTKKMLNYIEEDRANGKPFFGYLAYTAPHWPLQAPAESIAKFKGQYDAGYEALYAARFAGLQRLGLLPTGAEPIDPGRFNPRWDTLSTDEKALEARHMEIYAAMVSDLDNYIGEVVSYLKSINEFDNTFILFMSDNGAESSRRDLAKNIQDHVGKEYDHSLDNLGAGNTYVMYGANWASASETPFNRHKATGFEGGIHVPAFVHYKDLVKAGTRASGVSTVMDVLPTALALAGTTHPGTQYRGNAVAAPQGISMLPMLTGAADTIHASNEVLGWELFGHRSVRQGEWKIVWDQAAPLAQRRWALYNVAQDPSEQHDLSQSMPDKLAAMIANWDIYAKTNGVIY